MSCCWAMATLCKSEHLVGTACLRREPQALGKAPHAMFISIEWQVGARAIGVNPASLRTSRNPKWFLGKMKLEMVGSYLRSAFLDSTIS